MRNIRDLKYLIALADLGHFGKAADACFVSQPTLSTQLKKLEEELGVTLFERTNKHVLITPVGKLIADKARIILQHCEELKLLATNAKDIFSGTFRLGIIPTLGPYLLPHILKPIKKQLPKLELIVHENKTDAILLQLKNGDLDAVVLALPVTKDNLTVRELFCEPFCLALPKEHLLAKKKLVSLCDLKKETLLLLSEGHCFRNQALEACGLSSNPINTGFQATSLETLRQLVSANFGITLLPALSVHASKNDAAIVMREFSNPIPSRRIGMLWRNQTVRERCCEKIASLIQENVQKLSLPVKKNDLKIMKKSL
ncbi:MAG: LysR substrate-binding domain-containing protein [Coxiellaceae bacterium]|nr:LysR substrate-binding domain-containing protein [Coxiellaceae bacterium]